MSGWLIKVTSAGLVSDTRKIVEFWAAWVPDAADAVLAVETLSGVGDPPAETFSELSADMLRGFGLTEVGQVSRVKAIF